MVRYGSESWHLSAVYMSRKIHANLNFPFFCCSDYINPIDLCNRLNAYIIPEAAVHAFLTFLFVINGYWLAIVLNLPLLAFNAKKYVVSPACEIYLFPVIADQ